jgi:hypothetical protein
VSPDFSFCKINRFLRNFALMLSHWKIPQCRTIYFHTMKGELANLCRGSNTRDAQFKSLKLYMVTVLGNLT